MEIIIYIFNKFCGAIGTIVIDNIPINLVVEKQKFDFLNNIDKYDMELFYSKPTRCMGI
jgi:hypothetical protein